jgi:hypothetical protein
MEIELTQFAGVLAVPFIIGLVEAAKRLGMSDLWATPLAVGLTVTPVSESRIEGLATTTFPYRDFGLAIPDAPSVDTVADDVTLELEFVAAAP